MKRAVNGAEPVVGMLNPQFSMLDSGEVAGSVNKPFQVAAGNSGMGNNLPQNPAGGSVYISAQANWLSGAPSGDINWTVPVDTIARPEWQYSFPGYMISPHSIRDLWGGGGNPATKIVYWPLMNDSYEWRALAFALRSTRAGDATFLREVQQAVWSVNPNLPLATIQTLKEIPAHPRAQTSLALVPGSGPGAERGNRA